VRAAAALATVLMLLGTVAAAGATRRTPAPMAGLYNVLVVPFESFPATAAPGPRDALERSVVRLLDQWVAGEPAVGARGPAEGERVTVNAVGPREAARHGADVVVTGKLETARHRSTVVIEFVLTDRVFGETPEVVGRHEIGFTEPADVVAGNVELSRRLAEDALRYLKAVVAFVRGLGRYALDDYPGAERELRTAEQELTTIVSDPRRGTARSAVILLLLGNVVGRSSRYPEAAEIFRRALAQRPDYARAKLGLAEALRAGAGCDRRGDTGPVLRQALGHAEARAGQALTASLTATGTPTARTRRLTEAARGYEEALGLLSRTGMSRPSLRARELVFLRNPRDVYQAMGATDRLRAVEERIHDFVLRR
jgi:hypothetical protein